MLMFSIRQFVFAAAVGSAALAATPWALSQGVSAMAQPSIAWRPITLQVTGAEQPVRMEALRIDMEVAGGIAETRVQMTFLNPNARILEGRLKFPLAPHQVVSGFSLDVDGAQRDAVPVEKAHAQQVFEDITRRGADPGLLQTTLGNNYELRIYPLPPGRTRTVVLKIIEPASARLLVPLAYATRVANLAVSLRDASATSAPQLASGATLGLAFGPDPRGGYVARTARTDVVLPVTPLVVESTSRQGLDVTTEERDGQSFFAATLPVSTSMRHAPRKIPHGVEIVWDTSGSGAHRQLDRELALLDAYFARVRDTTVMLVRVADVASAPERFDVRGGEWQLLRRALQASVYDGASNLGAVGHDGVSNEVLWFTDGLANYGAAWKIAFPVPVFAINSAAGGDAAALQVLADRSGGRHIDLGVLSAAAAKDALLESAATLVELTATGASDLVAESQSAAAGRLVLAGQLTARTAEIRVRLRDAEGRITTQVLHVDARQGASRLAALQWARLTLASLAGEASINRARIRAIGQRFGLATSETSLIVLERVEDYVQNEIEPPAALHNAYARLLATATKAHVATDSARLEQLVRRFDARVAWWHRDFPKDRMPAAPSIAVEVPAPSPRPESSAAAMADRARVVSMPLAMAPPHVAPLLDRPAAPAPTLARTDVERKLLEPHGRDDTTIAISLTPAANGSAAIKRLRSAKPEERARIYADERGANAGNVGFFLDAADFFMAHEQRAVGLRVLSNLAELDLQNRQVLRLLAYRLQQAGEFELAVPIFERVLVLAPNEPQSHRDLGLALAEVGKPQDAIDRLYDVVTGSWDERFADIDLIALTELNAIAEKATSRGTKIDVTRVDRRLLKNLPLALRVVLAWDADNTDVDLHVIDPNGEEVFYDHALSYQGGAITHDATGGYGPEEFALRVAKPGTYRVEANFYGQRQQVLTTNTGLMLTLSSGFGTPRQQDRRSTRRVKSEHGERIVVGEFEVKD